MKIVKIVRASKGSEEKSAEEIAAFYNEMEKKGAHTSRATITTTEEDVIYTIFADYKEPSIHNDKEYEDILDYEEDHEDISDYEEDQQDYDTDLKNLYNRKETFEDNSIPDDFEIIGNEEEEEGDYDFLN